MGVRCSKGHELTPQGHEGHVRLQVIEQYVDCCDCRNQPTRELEGKMITIRRRDSFVDVSFQSLIELFDDRLREGGLLLNGEARYPLATFDRQFDLFPPRIVLQERRCCRSRGHLC